MTPTTGTRPHRHPLRKRLQQHPRVNAVAAVVVELEDVPRCVVVDLVGTGAMSGGSESAFLMASTFLTSDAMPAL